MDEIKFYKVEIPKNIWIEFKETITKNHTINEVFIELIKKRIEDFKEK